MWKALIKAIAVCVVMSEVLLAYADGDENIVSQSNDTSWAANIDVRQVAAESEDSALGELKDLKAIANSIQNLKAEVITLNKDLRQMEEKLLFPSNTRYTVFVSITTGQFFKLDSIKLKIDGKLVATHVYSDKQRTAMERGGIHRLYVTNMNEGKHEITAFFNGIGQDGRPYKRAANLDFEKSIGGEFLELAIVDDGSIQEPTFTLKRW
ncbi:hypothetical protein [Teredinibacter turnerae]|uniref:hypothetical protein n=1 Tax=Teredinibacter turnerae TaxID=2426 RepID=UPI0003792A10|nr:hypothetical protein [Teredinibacter turnerae]